MGKWFYTGLFMQDGKTPRAVYAADGVQVAECESKGYKPAEKKTKASRGLSALGLRGKRAVEKKKK